VPKRWDEKSTEEKLDWLRENKADLFQLKIFADSVHNLIVQAMACISVLGAMAETAAPDRERVREWCNAVRDQGPKISELELHQSAEAILDELRSVMTGRKQS
jgi:hypothetical protein